MTPRIPAFALLALVPFTLLAQSSDTASPGTRSESSRSALLPAPPQRVGPDAAASRSAASPTEADQQFRAQRAMPASAVGGGLGTASPNLTQIAAANESLARPNLTTRPIPQPTLTSGIGGFYVPSSVGPGVETPKVAFAPASAPSGIPAHEPFTSISYTGVSLAARVESVTGGPPRTLPATALHGRSLAAIEGVGRDVVTRTVMATWRVISWDGETLAVKDDQGHVRSFEVAEGTFVPRNLEPGNLVVLDFRRDGTLRSVRCPL